MVKFDKLTSFDLYNQEDDEIVCFYNLDQILENIDMSRFDLFANGIYIGSVPIFDKLDIDNHRFIIG